MEANLHFTYQANHSFISICLLFILAITLLNVQITASNYIEFLKWVSDWILFKGGSFQNFESGLVIAGVHWTLIYEWKFYFLYP